jgi:hypothetical protein
MTQGEIAAVLNRVRIDDVLRIHYRHPDGRTEAYEAKVHSRDLNADGSAKLVTMDHAYYSTWVTVGKVEGAESPCWYISKGNLIVVGVEILQRP